MDIFVDFFNWIIEGLAETIGWVIDLLPNSPISSFSNDKPENVTLGYITWIIPFPTMILHFAVILSCVAIYYFYRVIARWLKIVRG